MFSRRFEHGRMNRLTIIPVRIVVHGNFILGCFAARRSNIPLNPSRSIIRLTTCAAPK
jgi:hypothetical protein